MKILGHSSLRPRSISVPVGIAPDGSVVSLQLRAPRLGMLERLDAEIPEPQPPIVPGRVVRDHRGRPVEGPDGSPIPLRNAEDPAYVLKSERREKALSVAMVLSCLEPGQVTDLPDRNGQDPVDYFLAVWDGLEDAGLDIGAFRSLSEAAKRLGEPMSSIEVVQAKSALGATAEQQEGVASGK